MTQEKEGNLGVILAEIHHLREQLGALPGGTPMREELLEKVEALETLVGSLDPQAQEELESVELAQCLAYDLERIAEPAWSFVGRWRTFADWMKALSDTVA